MAEIMNSSLWRNDLDEIITSLPELDELSGSSVLITGAGGLICSALSDLLIRYNETHKDTITIYAAARNNNKTAKRFGEYSFRDYFKYVQYNALKENTLPRADYVIHGAGNSYPASFTAQPAETMMSNILGLKSLLDYSLGHTRRVIYISSSEVYGQRAENNTLPFTESDYGYVDILSPRSCYPMSKRAAETLCASYASEFGIEASIVRPGHVYGPSASESDNRVSSAFAWSAARGNDIVMKSSGDQLRSWCYCLDCASGILKVMMKGRSVCAYNIPGEVLSIRGMSEILAEAGGVRLIRECASEIERRAFNPMNNSSVNGARLEALGWHNLFTARRGLKHTVEILKFLNYGIEH